MMAGIDFEFGRGQDVVVQSPPQQSHYVCKEREQWQVTFA
jgi:hypothetical protein